MAITKHNEVNELLTLALGPEWIEAGLTSDTEQLRTVASFSRSQADNWLRSRDILDAKRLALDVDPDEWIYTLDLVSKLLGEMTCVALHTEETALAYLVRPESQIEFRRIAERRAARFSSNKQDATD